MKKSVLEYIKVTIEKFRNKTAIIDGCRQLTFGELDTRARHLGNCITNSTTLYKTPIAVLLPKSLESIVSFIGILYSGNIYVPLDIKLPEIRLKMILDDLVPGMVITNSEQKERLISAGIVPGHILCIDTLDLEENPGSLNTNFLADIANQMIDTDPAYIIYTSGSTGNPKGVVISHRGIIDYIDWAVSCFKIDETTIIGNQSPFYFDNSTLDIYSCFASAATLVIIPEYYFAFPIKLMEYVNEQKINFIFWVPSVLINIANTNVLDSFPSCTLKKILFAGEVMPNKQLNYWRRAIPYAIFANLYGPTEITVDCTFYIVDREFADNEQLPIGRQRTNIDILVLNNENLPAAAHEIGELCVRGSSLGFGYWNDGEKSRSVFVQNPLNAHYPETIYRTGDLVYYNERSEIIFAGRKDTQIKYMGYRIELGDIENALISLDGINGACVLYDETRKEIVALYVSDKKIDEAIIRKGLLDIIPKYMLPKKYARLLEFPINANGKVDRKLISANYFGGVA